MTNYSICTYGLISCTLTFSLKTKLFALLDFSSNFFWFILNNILSLLYVFKQKVYMLFNVHDIKCSKEKDHKLFVKFSYFLPIFFLFFIFVDYFLLLSKVLYTCDCVYVCNYSKRCVPIESQELENITFLSFFVIYYTFHLLSPHSFSMKFFVSHDFFISC